MQKLPQLWEKFYKFQSAQRAHSDDYHRTRKEHSSVAQIKLKVKETYCISSQSRHDVHNNEQKDGEFEDTKKVFGNCKSKKDRQNNGQKKKVKRTNNDLQNTTQKNDVEQHELY
jgi:hypothetical protein